MFLRRFVLPVPKLPESLMRFQRFETGTYGLYVGNRSGRVPSYIGVCKEIKSQIRCNTKVTNVTDEITTITTITHDSYTNEEIIKTITCRTDFRSFTNIYPRTLYNRSCTMLSAIRFPTTRF